MNETLQANKTVVKNFVEAVGCGDLETVESLMDPDIELHTMGSSFISATRNYAQICELVSGLNTVLKTRVELTYLALTAEEDRVSCEAQGKSTLVNDQPYNNQYHFLAYVRNGRIYKFKEYIDTKYTDAALGPLLA